MFNTNSATIISRIITLVIAFTVHEFSHAAAATLLGDETPRDAGRLTLNPFAHLDLIGTLMLVFAGFGWAKPVPVNPYRLRQRSKAGMLIVSLAGPLSNFLLAILSALILRFNLVPLNLNTNSFFPTFGQFLFEFLVINLTLFLFNLIPLSPLDGEKVFSFFIPDRFKFSYDKVKIYGPIVLLLIAVIGPRLGFDLLGIIVRQPMINLTYSLLGWN